jgi:UDP-N-acetylglucosamine acyltransferase
VTVTVHPSALVDPGAQLGAGVVVGPGATIEAGAVVGEGTVIQNGAIVRSCVVLGANCRIHPYVLLGEDPQDLKFNGQPGTVLIGDGTVIREFATIHRPTTEGGSTRIGKGCFLMVGTHVGHDAFVGDEVILVNYAGLSGHVQVHDQAFVSGFVGFHQHVRVGRNAMIGGMTKIAQDIPPYVMTDGNPPKPYGLNVVGLRRRGFSPDVRARIKRAYELVYRSGLNTSQALETIDTELSGSPEVAEFADFIRASTRGILK